MISSGDVAAARSSSDSHESQAPQPLHPKHRRGLLAAAVISALWSTYLLYVFQFSKCDVSSLLLVRPPSMEP